MTGTTHHPIAKLWSFLTVLVLSAAFAGPAYAQDTAAQPSASWSQEDMLRIATSVQKKILGLTNYGVFDDIHFGIRGKTVILNGYASRPSLKSDAEKEVKSIKGVESVENNIEVLPTSPNDDRIRTAVYNNIYGFGPLQKYGGSRTRIGRSSSIARQAGGITMDPPLGFHAIHIIVKNGNVTLRGSVLNAGDSALADIKANTTSGVFSVTNDLVIEGARRPAKQ